MVHLYCVISRRSMCEYFINQHTIIDGLSDKDKKNVKKVIGLIVADAYKEYCRINGDDPTKKSDTLKQLNEHANESMTLKNEKPNQLFEDTITLIKNLASRIDQNDQMVGLSEIKSIDGIPEEIKFPKDQFESKERRKLTMYAEASGLCSYTETQQDHEFLVIKKSKNEFIDISSPDPLIIAGFGFYHELQFSPENFANELKMLSLEGSFNDFCNDVKRYGLKGLSRLYYILIEEVVEYISNNEKYKALKRVKHTPLPGKIDNNYTICKMLYTPQNDGRTFVSLDFRAAVHRAYMIQGVHDTPWEIFISRFTKSRFLQSLKHLRLTIYGKLDHKNMNKIMFSNITLTFWNMIQNSIEDHGYKLLALEGDEILLEPPDNFTVGQFEQDIAELKLPDFINAQSYAIKHIPGSQSEVGEFYAKMYEYPTNKRFDVKCIDKKLYVKAYTILTNSFHK